MSSSASHPLRVLVVGAGSVGQVYGLFLQRAGAQVSVFVRHQYRAHAEAGFALYAGGRPPAARFRPHAVYTDWEAVSAERFDQIWLCVSSPALRQELVDQLAPALGGALLVALQPGERDRALLHPLVPPSRLVVGLIAFSAWPAPLPGGAAVPEPGQGYWFPPLTKSLFQGPRADEVVSPLRAAGCPAAVGAARAASARGSAALLALVATLETVGWSPQRLREPGVAEQVAGAAQEALAVGTTQLGVARGPGALLLRPALIRLASFVLPFVAPMSFPRFLQVHFTKVGDQTALALDAWIEGGDAVGLPTAHLRALRGRLQAARGATPEAR